uniref:Zona pellucida sperm-binding protein 1/4 Ig-like domain-containing protein n=1 Tax=Sparus aurata TaxID=8175 RepID=A0A671YK32_SPAAU
MMQTVTVISWQWLSVEFDVLSHQTEFVLFFFSVRYNLMNAKLKRVDPSVQCSENLMTLRVKGVRAPHILVDNERPLTPLSQMPSICGFSVRRSRRDVQFAAPYQGCHVTQQGGDYVLPLRLWGAPMTMSCPAVFPPPSVSCFPSGMVVKIGGNFELLVTCPSSPNIKPTTTTTAAPPTDRPVLQYPQYPQFPVFPQYPPGTVAPLPQQPQLPSGASTDTGNQESPAAQHPAFSFMPQYPQFPQYPLFPRPVPPMKPPAAPPAQLPQMPQSPQYPFPFFPQFPMVPGIFHPTTPPPPASVTTPAPTTKRDGKPVVPLQTQFPIPPQYPFLPFHPLTEPPEGQTRPLQGPKPVIHQHKPYQVYPQTYQIPVLYPPQKYPPQNTQTAAPTTASATSSATALKPAAQQPFYYPHPYMSAYYVPQPAPKPYPPTAPPVKPAPSDQHERQPPVFHAMPSFYPFPSYHMPKSVTKNS